MGNIWGVTDLKQYDLLNINSISYFFKLKKTYQISNFNALLILFFCVCVCVKMIEIVRNGMWAPFETIQKKFVGHTSVLAISWRVSFLLFILIFSRIIIIIIYKNFIFLENHYEVWYVNFKNSHSPKYFMLKFFFFP